MWWAYNVFFASDIKSAIITCAMFLCLWNAVECTIHEYNAKHADSDNLIEESATYDIFNHISYCPKWLSFSITRFNRNNWRMDFHWKNTLNIYFPYINWNVKSCCYQKGHSLQLTESNSMIGCFGRHKIFCCHMKLSYNCRTKQWLLNRIYWIIYKCKCT